jgi:hypothetical protein
MSDLVLLRCRAVALSDPTLTASALDVRATIGPPTRRKENGGSLGKITGKPALVGCVVGCAGAFYW